MTTRWSEILKTCIHGIREELDYHDCPKCKEMAIVDGLTWIDKKEIERNSYVKIYYNLFIFYVYIDWLYK